jgi:putative restriction endonuclease
LTALAAFVRRLTSLRVDSQRLDGVKVESPYKPALLLAVLDGIESAQITDNRIRITPELIAGFKAYCELLSPGPAYAAAPFQLPFFHLQGPADARRFWHLHPKPGRELVLTSSNSVRSFAHLRDVIAYAALDPQLWELLQQPVPREAIRQALLTRYFPLTRQYFRPRAGQQKLDELGQQMLQESPVAYQRLVDLADETDTFLRKRAFVQEVMRAYQSTCAISELQLLTTTGATPLLDACHIVPWSVGHDDTIGNGLALCPNLHRAFDRNLIWVDEDYRVRVAPGFGELSGHDYGVQRFNGKQLKLPRVRDWWPRPENFSRQRVQVW